MERFVVIGLGNFGGSLAVQLHELGLEVLGIDVDPDAGQLLRDEIPNVVIADATDRDTLVAVGADEVECAVISLGDALEASVLATLHCAELGIEHIYAKVVSETHGRILTRVGATEVVFPEREAARRLAHKLAAPNLVDFLPISPGYSVEQVRTPENFVGKTLVELDLRQRFGIQVIAIRDTAALDSPLRIPTGETVLAAEDQLVILGPNDKLALLSEIE